MTFRTALARIILWVIGRPKAAPPRRIPASPSSPMATPAPVTVRFPKPSPVVGPPAKDPHGQPYNVLFNRAGRTERDLSELLGLAKGMLADGVITVDEATYLQKWCVNHPDALAQWPVNRIAERLTQCFVDGHIDEAERADLRDLLSALVGGTASLALGYEAATALPLTDPAPLICWTQQVYVFTGRFAYGTRAACEREVTARGGTCESTVTKRTTFIVIGTFGSRDWKHSNYGGKIQKAMKLRDGGAAIKIVGEDHWANALTTGTHAPPRAVDDESPF